MEVTIKATSGIEADTIVSIRAGATRRQGRLALDQPFCFPNLLLNASPFKVDLLRTVASSRLSVGAETKDYEVTFPQTDQTSSMSMTLQLKEVPQHCGLPSKTRGHAGGVVTGTWEDAKNMILDQPEEKQASAASAACAYLDRFNLLNFVQEMLQYIIREKPEDPIVSMSEYLQKVVGKTLCIDGKKDFGATSAEAQGATNALRVDNVGTSEVQMAKTAPESVSHVPLTFSVKGIDFTELQTKPDVRDLLMRNIKGELAAKAGTTPDMVKVTFSQGSLKVDVVSVAPDHNSACLLHDKLCVGGVNESMARCVGETPGVQEISKGPINVAVEDFKVLSPVSVEPLLMAGSPGSDEVQERDTPFSAQAGELVPEAQVEAKSVPQESAQEVQIAEPFAQINKCVSDDVAARRTPTPLQEAELTVKAEPPPLKVVEAESRVTDFTQEQEAGAKSSLPPETADLQAIVDVKTVVPLLSADVAQGVPEPELGPKNTPSQQLAEMTKPASEVETEVKGAHPFAGGGDLAQEVGDETKGVAPLLPLPIEGGSVLEVMLDNTKSAAPQLPPPTAGGGSAIDAGAEAKCPPPVFVENAQHLPEAEPESKSSTAPFAKPKNAPDTDIETKSASHQLAEGGEQALEFEVRQQSPLVPHTQLEVAAESAPELEDTVVSQFLTEASQLVLEAQSGVKHATLSAEGALEVGNEMKNVLLTPCPCVPNVEPQLRDDSSQPLVEVMDDERSAPQPPYDEPTKCTPEEQLEAKNVPSQSPESREDMPKAKFEEHNIAPPPLLEVHTKNESTVENIADVVDLAEKNVSVESSTKFDAVTTGPAVVEGIICGEVLPVSVAVDDGVVELKQKDAEESAQSTSPPLLEAVPIGEVAAEVKSAPLASVEKADIKIVEPTMDGKEVALPALEKPTSQVQENSPPLLEDAPTREIAAQEGMEVKSARPPSTEQAETKIIELTGDGEMVAPSAFEKPSSEARYSANVAVATALPQEKPHEEIDLQPCTTVVQTEAFSTDLQRRETNDEKSTSGDVVTLISRQNVRLDAENERLRDEIREIQGFCQTRGLSIQAPWNDDTFVGLSLIQQQEELSVRNRELRAEHERLCSTLGSFCKGLTELADQLSSAMSTAHAERSHDPPTIPSRSETVIAEEAAAATCARLEEEQKKLMREIRELEARRTPSPAALNSPIENHSA